MRKIDKLLLVVKDPTFLGTLISFKVAASVEHSQLLNYLNNIGINTIVDIGANRGQFALAARKHFPMAKIFSFEPLLEPTSLFRKIFANDPNTILYELAIGTEEAETIIHISNADDSSSLLPISTLQNELYPGTSEKETRTIVQKPLDAILSPLDIKRHALLKIDVQGYEKQVLEGCKSLLPLFTYIYVECSFVELYEGQSLAHEIISYLSKYGFILSGVYNLDIDKKGIPIQGDFFFTRN